MTGWGMGKFPTRGGGLRSVKKRPKWRSFVDARSFVHTLKLENGTEWKLYIKGALKDDERRLLGIPSNPNIIYKDQGWQGFGDWLGNGKISYQREGLRSVKKDPGGVLL